MKKVETIKLFLSSKSDLYNASGVYEISTKKMTVLKGTRVSDNVSHTGTFKIGDVIEEIRMSCVKEGILQKDVVFSSASTAANFVTGRSTNGLITWKDVEGTTLKTLLFNMED